MTALGLARAAEAGYQHDFDVPAIARSVLDSLDEDTLTPGDLGLCLWLDQRLGTDRADAILSRIGPAVAASGGLQGCEGMEIAWIAIGAAESVAQRSRLNN